MLSNRSEFEEFLIFNLKEINEAVSDPANRVYALITTLSAGGEHMMESMFRSYISDCQLPEEILYPELAFFAGMNYFNIGCDCQDPECLLEAIPLGFNYWYEEGKGALTNNTEEYIMIGEEISHLRKLVDG